MISSPKQRPLVLLVDDEEIVRILLTEYLYELDIDLIEAGDGRAALDKIAQNGVPDLIISDLMMPGMDGYKLLNEVRANQITSGIPVFVITANGAPETKVKVMGLGATEFHLKPLDQELIVKAVEKIVTESQADC